MKKKPHKKSNPKSTRKEGEWVEGGIKIWDKQKKNKNSLK